MKTMTPEKLPAPRVAAADNLILLTGTSQFQSFQSPIWMTRSLWRTLAGGDEFQPDDPRLDEIFFYLVFAMLGMVGFDHHRSSKSHTLLVPVTFESGSSTMRVTTHEEPVTGKVLTLSLPEERIA